MLGGLRLRRVSSAGHPISEQSNTRALLKHTHAKMAKVIRKDLEKKLAALDGAEWDSMSESDLSGDDINETSDGEELKAPPLPLHAQQKKKRDKQKGKGSVVPVGPAGEPSGVVRIGHIPHGFYEEAMNGFFKQFGDVIRVRISRSKKSGRCKVRLVHVLCVALGGLGMDTVLD